MAAGGDGVGWDGTGREVRGEEPAPTPPEPPRAGFKPRAGRTGTGAGRGGRAGMGGLGWAAGQGRVGAAVPPPPPPASPPQAGHRVLGRCEAGRWEAEAVPQLPVAWRVCRFSLDLNVFVSIKNGHTINKDASESAST